MKFKITSAVLAALFAAGCCNCAQDPLLLKMQNMQTLKEQFDARLAKGGTAVSKNMLEEARAIEKPQLVYPVLYKPGKKFTGNLADWKDIPFQGIALPTKSAIKYPPELKANFKACITDTDLYVLFTATDSVKVFDEISSHFYIKDCFELFLDPFMKRAADSDDTTSQTFVTPKDPSCKTMLCSGKLPMKAKYIALPDGWGAEVKIPLKNKIFKVKPYNGLCLGFNMTYCNNNTPGKLKCQGKLNWCAVDVGGDSYRTPAVLGVMQVVMDKPAPVQAVQLGPDPAKRKAIRSGGETLKDLSRIQKAAKTLQMTRGFNGEPTCSEWGANNARFNIIHWGLRKKSFKEAWPQGLNDLEKKLQDCRKRGVKAIFTLGSIKLKGQVWSTAANRKRFTECWKEAVRRIQPYKDTIWAIDLLNEPLDLKQLPYAPAEYRPFMVEVVKEIRKIDKDLWIIYEVGPGGGWRGFEDLKPLPDDHIIYGLHFYTPGTFTHQGVNFALLQDLSLINKEQKGNQMKYPGVYFGTWFDKTGMKKQLSYVIDFQKKYKAPIYVGEFSVAAWADPKCSSKWLEDAISIFEEYGWSWSYHCWRGWPGWSLEIEDGVLKNPKKSDKSVRAKVVRKALERNKK